MKLKRLLPITVALVVLQGCAVAVVGATAVGVKSATDRRSIGTQLDDQTVEVRVRSALNDQARLAQARIKAVGYNDAILLVGQVPNNELKTLANRTARDVNGVKQVHNELRIGNPIGFTTQTQDTWLTSKVKTKLLSDEAVDGSQIKVVTENSEVFLMGIVSTAESQAAIEITRNTAGVKHVITAFDVRN